MIIDYYGRLSTNCADTTATTHYSTNIIDTEIADPNLGKGNDIYVACKVRTAVTAATGSTLTIALQDCDTSGGTFTDMVQSEDYDAFSGIAAGEYLLHVAIPKEHKRFIKAAYVIGTAAVTAGAWDTWLYIR